MTNPPLLNLSLRLLLPLLSITILSVANLQAQESRQGFVQKIAAAASDTDRVQALLDFAIFLEGENMDSAAFYYEKAGDLSRKLNYYNGMQRYASNFTIVLNAQGHSSRSRDLNAWALEMAQQHHDLMGQAKGHNNLGSSFLTGGNHDSAFYHYAKAIELLETLNNETYLPILYSNILALLENIGEYDKAMDYGRRAVALSERLNDSLQHAVATVNLAILFASRKTFDSAIYLVNSVLPVLERARDGRNLASAYITLGDAHTSLRQSGLAIESFSNAIRVAREIRDSASIAVANNGIAMAQFRLKNLQQANRYIDRTLAMIDNIPVLNQSQVFKLGADIKAGLGMHEVAFDLLKKYVLLNDSLTGLESRKHVADLEEKFQSVQRNKEILEKQLRIEETEAAISRKNLLLIILAIVIILSTAIAIIYYRFYRQRKKLHASELETINHQRELERLKAGMEGQMQERKRIAAEMHDDLGSGLTSILFMTDAALNDPAQGRPAIKKIADTAGGVMNKMNEIIWSMNDEYDSLEDLVAYIRRHSGELLSQVNLAYTFHIPEKIPAVQLPGAKRRNLQLVVKESLHNIIKHAKAGHVTIAFSIDNELRIEIADDGVGMDPDRVNRFGNGLRNMRHRMETIGGAFEIRRNPGRGTCIRVSLPLSMQMRDV